MKITRRPDSSQEISKKPVAKLPELVKAAAPGVPRTLTDAHEKLPRGALAEQMLLAHYNAGVGPVKSALLGIIAGVCQPL
jgi:hypothetical protein